MLVPVWCFHSILHAQALTPSLPPGVFHGIWNFHTILICIQAHYLFYFIYFILGTNWEFNCKRTQEFKLTIINVLLRLVTCMYKPTLSWRREKKSIIISTKFEKDSLITKLKLSSWGSWWESSRSFSLLNSNDGMDVDPWLECTPMSRKNRRLVTIELVEFEKWRVEVGDFNTTTDHSRGIYRIKHNRKMSTCIQLDLESLGSWPTISNNFLGTDVHTCTKRGNKHVRVQVSTLKVHWLDDGCFTFISLIEN